jgi:hypothetical protein
MCKELLGENFSSFFSGFILYGEHVLSQLCRAIALPKGTETFLFEVILFFALFRLSIACLSSFVCFFFLFLLYCQMCVLSMHSSRGRLRTYLVPGPVDGRFLV